MSDKVRYPLSMSIAPSDAIIADAKKHKVIAFDTEWDAPGGMDPNKDGFCIHGASFSTPSGFSNYFTNRKIVRKIFKALLPIKDIEWVSHSATADWKAVRLSNWIPEDMDYPELIADTMIGANLLYDHLNESQLGIKSLVRMFFKTEMMEFEDASDQGLDTEKFRDYAIDDAYQELRFYLQIVKPKLINEKLFKYFLRIPAIAAFVDMEITGIVPDPQRAMGLIHVFSEKAEEIKDQLWMDVKPFNPNSGVQLAERLFNDLGVVPPDDFPRTETGKLSTDAKAINRLAKDYPFVQTVSTYRTAGKMISTYLAPAILEAPKQRDGRIHPHYWLVSATGRTRSSGYNAQNTPNKFYDGPFKDIAIRDIFVAPEGFSMVGADASQGELRLMAHLTLDPNLLKAYLNWRCNTCKEEGSSVEILHECPNCGEEEKEAILKHDVPGFWHGLDIHTQTFENTKALKTRNAAKGANFGLLYGGGAYIMNSLHPSMSVEEWEEAIYDWFELYSGVAIYHEKIRHSMSPKKGCVVKDLFGRKRRISGKEIQEKWKHSLNQLLNFPAQASLCAWCQLAMTKFRKEMVKEKLWMKEVFPTNFIHDEIQVFAKEDIAHQVGERLVWHIEHASSMRVPMRSSLSVAQSWGALK